MTAVCTVCGRPAARAAVRIGNVTKRVATLCRRHRKDFWRVSS